MLDLFLVSVLLDAGAGTEWSYKSAENGRVYRRSEGIAVATLDMFKTVRSPRPLIGNLCVSDANAHRRGSSPATKPTSTRSTRTACVS